MPPEGARPPGGPREAFCGPAASPRPFPAPPALLLALLLPALIALAVAPGGALAQGIPSGGVLAQAVPLPSPPPAAPGPPVPPDLAAPALVAEMGTPRVEVTTAFSGADVLVFGATLRPLGPQQSDNVVVIAQGPSQAQVVRRRVRVLGAWINGPSARFEDVPSWYAMSATAPLGGLLTSEERTTKGLGLDALARQVSGQRAPEFRQALLRGKIAADLWNEDEAPVTVSGGRLFQARLPLPSTVPTGDYLVQVLLVRGGRVVARQELPFRVERTGSAAEIADVARQTPLLYGLGCIVLAAFAGWLGSVLFRR